MTIITIDIYMITIIIRITNKKMEIEVKRMIETKTDVKPLMVFVATIFLLMAINSAYAAEYEVIIKDHRFIPDEIEMSSGEKHRLIVHNNDATPEEFESYELNREKIITGHSKAVIFLPSLEPGTYPFFGEFNEDTAQGRIVVK